MTKPSVTGSSPSMFAMSKTPSPLARGAYRGRRARSVFVGRRRWPSRGAPSARRAQSVRVERRAGSFVARTESAEDVEFPRELQRVHLAVAAEQERGAGARRARRRGGVRIAPDARVEAQRRDVAILAKIRSSSFSRTSRAAGFCRRRGATPRPSCAGRRRAAPSPRAMARGQARVVRTSSGRLRRRPLENAPPREIPLRRPSGSSIPSKPPSAHRFAPHFSRGMFASSSNALPSSSRDENGSAFKISELCATSWSGRADRLAVRVVLRNSGRGAPSSRPPT